MSCHKSMTVLQQAVQELRSPRVVQMHDAVSALQV